MPNELDPGALTPKGGIVNDYWNREAELEAGETFAEKCARLEERNRKLEQALRRILEARADYRKDSRKEHGIDGRRLASYGFVRKVLLALAEVEELLKP